MGLVSTLAGTAAGAAISRSAERVDQSKEWIGRWWAVPLTAAHVGLQMAAYKLFEGNEKLQNDVIVAPTVSLLGAVAAGYLIDKAFRRKEVTEKVAMFFAGGVAAAAGAYAAVASNGEGNWDGIQSGALAIPFGEGVVITTASTGAAYIGIGIGEALHRDEPTIQRRG